MNYFELLSMAEDYKVEKNGEAGYTVRDENHDLAAFIDEFGIIDYYISNVYNNIYNSGCNYLEIDIDKILKLKNFCEMVVSCK